MTTTTVATMTVAEVMAETIARVTAIRDAATGRGEHELAAEFEDMLDDLGDDGMVDVSGPDRGLPMMLAALLGVTLSDR